MNTKRYLDRINYTGPTMPAADTLRNLHIAHLRSVPFENLDIHLGRPILLDEAGLYEKIVARGRGGFCYEENGLFAWLLRELGFDVTLLSARVAGCDGVFGQEFDHLTLRVICPADPMLPSVPWLADVGFGDSFHLPLRLDRLGEAQPQGPRAYRLDQEGSDLLLWQRGFEGAWEKQYRFSQIPRQLEDFEQACIYHQTSPESHFTQNRICSLATENGRITLSDRRLIETEERNKQERLVDQEEYEAVLTQLFGIFLP